MVDIFWDITFAAGLFYVVWAWIPVLGIPSWMAPRLGKVTGEPAAVLLSSLLTTAIFCPIGVRSEGYAFLAPWEFGFVVGFGDGNRFYWQLALAVFAMALVAAVVGTMRAKP